MSVKKERERERAPTNEKEEGDECKSKLTKVWPTHWGRGGGRNGV